MSKCPDLEGIFWIGDLTTKQCGIQETLTGFNQNTVRDSGNVNGIRDLTATQEAELHRIRDWEERY